MLANETNPMTFALLILVGPSDLELDRLRKLLRSLFLFGSRVQEVVLIDNTPEGRHLERSIEVPAGVRLTSLLHERQGRGQESLGAGCWAVLQGLRYLATESPARPVIKLDTDALVIGPFEDRLEELLRKNPELGTAGVVEWNCDGSKRNWEPFGELTQHLARLVRWQRHGLLPRRLALFGRWALYRRVIRQARRHGYRWGEHPQGGAYLVSPELIQRMLCAGDLDDGPAWHALYMGEDVMLGIYAVACGLKNVHFGRAGEVFGIAHQGLPFAPEEMLQRGYAFAHSLKNDPAFSEKALYDFFESRSGNPAQ